MVQLSNRLKEVASFVKKNAVLADIGSDHAYLPTYLVKEKQILKAIAGEVVKGPYESAVRNVRKENVEDYITVRLANGLKAIEEQDSVDTVTIAGMGGTLIAKILEEGTAHLTTVQRIIAQPNIHAEAIRQWAVANKWHIIAEKILKEDDKIYEIIVLERGISSYDSAELLLGPFLIKEKNDVFQEKWQHEMAEWQRILQLITQAKETADTIEKRAILTEQIEIVEGVLE